MQQLALIGIKYWSTAASQLNLSLISLASQWISLLGVVPESPWAHFGTPHTHGPQDATWKCLITHFLLGNTPKKLIFGVFPSRKWVIKHFQVGSWGPQVCGVPKWAHELSRTTPSREIYWDTKEIKLRLSWDTAVDQYLVPMRANCCISA